MTTDRPPTLAFPIALTVFGLTVPAGLAGAGIALQMNDGTAVALVALAWWFVGHSTTAALAWLSRPHYGVLATRLAVAALALLGLPFALVLVLVAWLSQQPLWTIG